MLIVGYVKYHYQRLESPCKSSRCEFKIGRSAVPSMEEITSVKEELGLLMSMHNKHWLDVFFGHLEIRLNNSMGDIWDRGAIFAFTLSERDALCVSTPSLLSCIYFADIYLYMSYISNTSCISHIEVVREMAALADHSPLRSLKNVYLLLFSRSIYLSIDVLF